MGKTNNRRGSTEKTTIPGITVNIETVLPGLPGLQLRGKEEAISSALCGGHIPAQDRNIYPTYKYKCINPKPSHYK